MESKSNKYKKNFLQNKFILHLSAIIILFVFGIYIGLYIRNSQLIKKEVISKARSYVTQIILTRRWNAFYGGVYVEKTANVKSNPYLENPDIKTIDGKTYTKKNPALMAREISEYAEKLGLFKFHLTSLKPLNPKNKPDKFEETALNQFKDKEKDEFYLTEKNGNKFFFRYMKPLYVEKSCLQCHEKQGYKIGDLRGGISTEFDITQITANITNQKYYIISISILSMLIIILTVYCQAHSLFKKLRIAQDRIEELLITDELTGLYNRRYLNAKLKEEFIRAKRYKNNLSCIMIDVDYFKRVNDTHGHNAGDLVLKNISQLINSSCRGIDIVTRFGGEEIFIILPETNLKNAAIVAERNRKIVGKSEIEINSNEKIFITISLGIASISPDKIKDIDNETTLIKQSDDALYSAKNNGRNRVEIYNGNNL